MRILIVDQGEIFGGAELFTLDLVRTLPKNEYDVHVAYAETADQRYIDALKDIPYIKTVSFPLPKLKPVSAQSILMFLKAVFILRKYCKKHKIEVLHSNTVRTHIVLSPVSKMLGKPLTWVLHDFTFPQAFLKRLAGIPKTIICVSEKIQRYLFDTAGKEAGRKSIVIPNGVESPRSTTPPAYLTVGNEQFTYDSSKRYVGIIGRIDTWKGQDVFVRAAEILNNDYPQHHNIEYLIIGSATETSDEKKAYFASLQRFVKERNLDNIHFVGQQPIAEVLPFLSVLVNASTEAEPFGRTIIEAFAYGIPVVASRIGAPEEIIDYGQTGLLSEPKNPQDLAQKISLLLEDHHLAETLKMNGKKEVRAKYELSTVVDSISDTWQRAHKMS